MINIKLVCVGKIKESFFNEAIEEYKKRIKAFANFKIIEKLEYNTQDDKKNLYEESKLILNEIKDDYVVTLEIEGENISSEKFASLIQNHYIYSSKTIAFVIGSSTGLDDTVKKRSDYKLSFSKMTFPHQLMRVIFTEQLYRALSIINNTKYHK